MNTLGHTLERDRKQVEEALAALQAHTGIGGVTNAVEVLPGRSYVVDARIDLHVENETHHYLVECKSFIDRKAQVEQVRRQFSDLGTEGVLVAPYLSRELAEYCRKIGQQFIDTHGNAYLRGPGLFVFVSGERQEDKQRTPRASKGIANAASLRVALALLGAPHLVNATFKNIAAAAGVSLGTANNTIDELARRGYLINKGSAQQRKLLEPMRLLDEWAINYPSVLRPKLLRRRFSPPDREWWMQESLADCAAVWGGEVAAHALTNYLKPATQAIYVRADKVDDTTRQLVKHHRLRPDPNGSVELLEKFWHSDLETRPGIAPPIVVYAELLALLDPRTYETADLIKEKWIDPTFG
ncbi:hypothetical protein GJ700_24690 [Duganella sp. FT92W]|uniref:Restriction endonuclease type IV Mrr domain-containing protein n=1 Tax=Pseudoduganella rivuli TaxID=2666085 RepID=A0A7X2IRN6_9BURK|nr:type IV toxin-antitoxin system AbiEi family antitoxin [Pseudoduganella rivuli]MRV74916.1 hypothetical protein [Pseudoduganella rivuli]